jgi:hypothetical protein
MAKLGGFANLHGERQRNHTVDGLSPPAASNNVVV